MIKIVLIIYFTILSRLLKAGHIYSWDVTTEYDYNGALSAVNLIFMLESGLGPNDYFQISLPFNISYCLNTKAQLYTNEDSKAISSWKTGLHDQTYNAFLNNVYSTYNWNYFFAFGIQLNANVWYKIKIKPDLSQILASPGIQEIPIAIQTQSTIDSTEAIIYDMNHAFSLIFISEPLTIENLVINFQIDSFSQSVRDPGAYNFAFIDITPSVGSLTGAIFTIFIDNVLNTPGYYSSDFNFRGKCQSQQFNNIEQVINSNCEIDQDDRSKLVFMYNEGFQAQRTFRIQVEVENPMYISQRDLKGYSVSNTNGRLLEKGKVLATFAVDRIQLHAGNKKFLWGINSNEGISQTPYKLFKQKAAGILPPYNSVYLGFKISKALAAGIELVIYLKLEATSILEGSIITNLPPIDNNEVKCKYTYPNIICQNVGYLDQPFKEYYISTKIFYSSTSPNPTEYGKLIIKSIIYDKGVRKELELFDQLPGENIILHSNSEFLDSGSGGWHDSNTFGLGTTQVISAPDDGTNTATQSAITNVIHPSATSGSVGIFPEDFSPSQLLFFLKVDTNSMYKPVGIPEQDKYIKMIILFNPQVIMFESGLETAGLDYAAYSEYSGVGSWDMKNFPCFKAQYCSSYNPVSSSQANVFSYVDSRVDQSSAGYAFAEFECGIQEITGNLKNLCNNLQGYSSSGTNGTSGIFAMRQVRFPDEFHSQLYPDQHLLDFVVTFSQARVLAQNSLSAFTVNEAQLINAYTLNNQKLTNAKISYVNYYQTASQDTNIGIKIPMLLRIGGSILLDSVPEQIHVFFDNFLNCNAFREDQTDEFNYNIYCSTDMCKFYDNGGSTTSSQDSWHTQNRIEVSNLPDMGNEFNIFIPIQKNSLISTIPQRLVLAFSDSSYSPSGLSRNQRVLHAYRVFGPPISATLNAQIPIINQLTASSAFVLNYLKRSTPFVQTTYTGSLKYQVELSGVKPGYSDTVYIRAGTTNISYKAGDGMFGAAITFSSFNVNILEESNIKFQDSIDKNLKQCVKLSYKYNAPLASPDQFVQFTDQKYFYLAICPIDLQFNLSNSAADMIITKAKFPSFFIENYPLSSVFSYGLSTSNGELVAFSNEAGTIPSATGSMTCLSAATLLALAPNSPGTQILTFPIQLSSMTSSVGGNNSSSANQIITTLPMDNSAGKYGFSSVKVVIQLSSPFFGLSVQTPVNGACQILSPLTLLNYIQCKYEGFVSDKFTFILQGLQKFSLSLTQEIQISIKVTSSNQPSFSPSNGVTYNVTVYLPTSSSGLVAGELPRMWGDLYQSSVSSQPVLSRCYGGLFQLLAQPYDQQISLSNLAFTMPEFNARSELKIDFKSQSTRDTFIADQHYYNFEYGFLAQPNQIYMKGSSFSNEFRCIVYENSGLSVQGSLPTSQISWKWSKLKLVTIGADTYYQLFSKSDIQSIQQYYFSLKCFGGAAVTSDVKISQITGYPATPLRQSMPIKLQWKEIILPASSVNIQQNIVDIVFSQASVQQVTKSFTTYMPQLQKKLFGNFGFEAFYYFQIASPNTDLDYLSRIYIEFPYYVPPRLNKEGVPECYIRESQNEFEQSSLTFCELISERKISVWVNRKILKDSPFFIDVLGVGQPFMQGANINQQIWIGIDQDSDPTNGLSVHGYMADRNTSTLLPSNLLSIPVLNVSISSNLLRQTHDLYLIIQLQGKNVMQDKSLYIDFPSVYGQSIQRGSFYACKVQRLQRNQDGTYEPAMIDMQLQLYCQFISKRRLQVVFIQDILNGTYQSTQLSQDYYAYNVTIFKLPSPSKIVSQNQNKIRLLCFTAEGSDKIVTSIGLDYQSLDISFASNTQKSNLDFYFYTFYKNITYGGDSSVTEQLDSVNSANISIGYYSRFMLLQQQKSESSTTDSSSSTGYQFVKFEQALDFAFTNEDISFLKFRPGNLHVDKNTMSSRFSLGALQGTKTGIITLYPIIVAGATVTNDNLTNISSLPLIQLVIRDNKCQMMANNPSYKLPEEKEGHTLPIILDFYNCFPVQDVSATPIFSSNQLELDNQYTIDKLNSSEANDTKLLFVVKQKSSSTLVSGNIATMSFSFAGSNGLSYENLNTIQLVIVKADQEQIDIQPSPKTIVNLTTYQNTVTMILQCNQPAIMFWAIGIVPSMDKINLENIKSRVLPGNGKGLLANYSDINDPYFRYYGSDIQMTATESVKKAFTGLKSRQLYQINYYCVNQLGKASESFSTQWYMTDNGSFLMKVLLSFNGPLTYSQLNQIACQLAKVFELPKLRVITELSTYCDYPNFSVYLIKPYETYMIQADNENQYYTYKYYIIPDYFSSIDLVNLEIKESVRDFNNFYTALSSDLQDKVTYPSLMFIDTEDVQQYDTPNIIVTQNSIYPTFFTIELVNSKSSGFLVIGLREGESNGITPTLQQMKQGLWGTNETTDQMMYCDIQFAKQNQKQSFKFTKLTPNRVYTLFAYATVDDPSDQAMTSPLLIYQIKTVDEKPLVFIFGITKCGSIPFYLLAGLLFLLIAG